MLALVHSFLRFRLHHKRAAWRLYFLNLILDPLAGHQSLFHRRHSNSHLMANTLLLIPTSTVRVLPPTTPPTQGHQLPKPNFIPKMTLMKLGDIQCLMLNVVALGNTLSASLLEIDR
jgi:hypothetical protein